MAGRNDALPKALRAIDGVTDPQDLAHLLLLAVELYADAGSKCDEAEAVDGESAPQVTACNREVGQGREELLAAFRRITQRCPHQEPPMWSPEQRKALESLDNAKIVHIHDDGDLTVDTAEGLFVVTTDGRVFKEVPV